MRISDWSSDVCSSDLPEHSAAADDQENEDVERGQAHRLIRITQSGAAAKPVCGSCGTGPLLHPATHRIILDGWSGGVAGRCRANQVALASPEHMINQRAERLEPR